MFGSTVDYWLLRPLTHRRYIATEEELDARADVEQPFDAARAQRRLDKWNRRLDNRLPLRRDWRYLDVGCGQGDLTIAFAMAGCGYVCGIDMIARNIARAKSSAAQLGLKGRVEFVCGDVHEWQTRDKFDVILSHEALEHILEPKAFLQRLADVVADNGLAVLAFGPLFHSPLGDHMNAHFRVPIPWKGALFSEQANLRLRAENFRPGDYPSRYQDMKGGLNLMRYSEFLRYVRETGWHVDTLRVNPQLRGYPPLYWMSCGLTRLPIVRDYFASSIYTILRRQPTSAS